MKKVTNFKELYELTKRGEIINAYTDITLFGNKPKVVIEKQNTKYHITEKNFEDYKKYL